MATPLPIIPLATFTVEDQDIPGGYVRLKPFTLGLESLLLQAKGMNEDKIDIKDAIEAVHQVIEACAVEPGFSARGLPMWVVELLFIRLRQHSVGETIDLAYRCPTVGEDEKQCGERMDYTLDLRDLEVKREGYVNKFTIHDDPQAPIGVTFKGIGLEAILGKTDITHASLLASQVETISHGDEVYKASDYTPEDLLNFIKSIPLSKRDEIVEGYLTKLPNTGKEIELKCGKCGSVHKITLKGITDFFG